MRKNYEELEVGDKEDVRRDKKEEIIVRQKHTHTEREREKRSERKKEKEHYFKYIGKSEKGHTLVRRGRKRE